MNWTRHLISSNQFLSCSVCVLFGESAVQSHSFLQLETVSVNNSKPAEATYILHLAVDLQMWISYGRWTLDPMTLQWKSGSITLSGMLKPRALTIIQPLCRWTQKWTQHLGFRLSPLSHDKGSNVCAPGCLLLSQHLFVSLHKDLLLTKLPRTIYQTSRAITLHDIPITNTT